MDDHNAPRPLHKQYTALSGIIDNLQARAVSSLHYGLERERAGGVSTVDAEEVLRFLTIAEKLRDMLDREQIL